MKKIVSGIFVILFMVTAGYGQESKIYVNGDKKLSKCMDKANSIKVGMIRADIEKLFYKDGGLMGIFRNERYVLRDCHCQGSKFIKVNVSFKPFGKQVTGIERESPKDVITEVTEPYCQYGISD